MISQIRVIVAGPKIWYRVIQRSCLLYSQECSGSICTLIGSGGWTECSKSTDDGAEAASLCFISCAFGGTCYNSYDTASLPQDFKDLLTQHNNGNMIPSKPGELQSAEVIAFSLIRVKSDYSFPIRQCHVNTCMSKCRGFEPFVINISMC